MLILRGILLKILHEKISFPPKNQNGRIFNPEQDKTDSWRQALF